MSLAKSVIKLNAFKPMMSQARMFNSNFVVAPPSVKIPKWKRMALMGFFVTVMLSYPYYVVWMMPVWDEKLGNK